MTPRTRTNFIEASLDIEQALNLFRSYRHPRVPVYRGSRDNLVGFLHAEDIVRIVFDEADVASVTLADLLRPPVVVPLTKKVDEMFDFFQAHQARAAAVLNEFGGVEGFVTMKDVLTFIFGQISGEIRGQEHYRERDEDVYEVPGEMKLTDFNNLSNFGIEDPRMTTIGGVAFRHLDRLPRVGDDVYVEGIRITVREMEAHRIARVRVARGRVALEREGDDTPVGEAAHGTRSHTRDEPGDVTFPREDRAAVAVQDTTPHAGEKPDTGDRLTPAPAAVAIEPDPAPCPRPAERGSTETRSAHALDEQTPAGAESTPDTSGARRPRSASD